MSFYDYLESRYVSSQLSLNKKQTTKGHAHNHALLFLMWVSLKIGTAFATLGILAEYFAVLVRLKPTPKPAREIAREALEEGRKEKAEMSQVVSEITKGASHGSP